MGREKGNVAEREVAALIKAWWGQLEPKADFIRTPLSGGWGGPTQRAGFKASGDLMTTAERFPFTVEVKRREAWSMDRLLAGSRSPVWGWWRQAQTQGVEMSATPMLWIRRSREPWRVLVPWALGEEVRRRGVEVEVWETWALAKVDVGDQDPAMFLADALLALPPKLFATSTRRSTTRG